jgi:hypothetical protein
MDTESEDRLRFEALLAETSSRFINLPADRMDDGIEGAQRRICGFLDLDRSSLWQVPERDPRSMKGAFGNQTKLKGRKSVPERDLFYCMTKKMNISLILAALAVWMFVGAAQCQFFGPSAQRDVQQGAEVAKPVEQQIGVYGI